MDKKSIWLSSMMMVAIGGLYTSARVADTRKAERTEDTGLEARARLLPDSLFSTVEKEDLLQDGVYLQLIKEGWQPEEIMRIMKTALADKQAAKSKDGYIHYAKEVVPLFRRMVGGDTLANIMDTVYNEKMRRSVEKTTPAELLNAYWEPKPYIPPRDRVGDNIREGGYFKQPKFMPSCGRICWMTLHPDDPNKLYVAPDGAGIFKTDDCGEHWECITDRIPVRADRSNVNGYAIPVDPDDWNHVFAFMNNNVVYETFDGGLTWQKIEGASHKGFKRGDCFRDADGNLKFIGCYRTSWDSELWISEDMCKTWTLVDVPAELKDIHPQTGVKGLWFQYIVTDPTDRNKIYLPTSRSILYFDDGAKSTTVNGKKVYNIKKMHFRVNDAAGNRRVADHPTDQGADTNNDAIFPCPANQVGDLVINPNKPTQWWFATGSNCCGKGNASALYRSEDGGRTWVTLQDLAFDMGKGCIFGNELASVWLGGFGVNFADTTKVYGCSMSSAKSKTGGRVFDEFGWWAPLNAKNAAGNYQRISYSRHNADNHCIRSHKTGRVFRGSDGGMLMLDPNINGGEWTQIGGDMGQMLFYHVAVNEFGDQVIAGNTQDVDGQTYRYGRWGHWRGYEGSESFINPYTSAVYFPAIGNVGWAPGQMPLDSWYNASTRADVVTGSWFISRSGMNGKSFLRCDDYGQYVVNLEPILGSGVGYISKFGLCRDKGISTLYVLTNANKVRRSTDNGNTFDYVTGPDGVNPLDVPNRVLATDPNNSDVLYFGMNGAVWRYTIPTRSYERLGGEPETPGGLPRIQCSQLIYHEGSGDLYFYHSGSASIYILECLDKKTGKYKDAWRFWTRGYNSGKASNLEINYTTQEMVICDFGRGVWCADLEHPADRFFDNGFALREYSFKDGRRTIGIDTEWTIPLYYYFKWTVNGEVVADCPYQYLRKKLKSGDRVQLELTLRESPDVHTTSAVFIVPQASAPDDEKGEDPGQSQGNGDGNKTTPTLAASAEGEGRTETETPKSYDSDVPREPGRVLYSNGRGRVELGYFDYFFNDFSIDFWLKPQSDGTILANRTREGQPKGWELMVESGKLKFEYSPRNTFNLPVYEEDFTQMTSLSGGAVKYGSWNHVAVTHERNGSVSLYLNGVLVASAPRILKDVDATLNSMVLSLFGDGIERYTIEAAIDELKIWTVALTEEQVRREMFSTNASGMDGLAAYWAFNGGILESDIEMFTRKAPRPRVNAETSHTMMNVPTCARHICYGELTATAEGQKFKAGDNTLIGLTPEADKEGKTAAGAMGTFGVYGFKAEQWQNEEDNLDTDFFDYHPTGYLVHGFGNVDTNSLWTIDFHPVEGEFDSNRSYRLYASAFDGDRQVWEQVGNAAYNAETGTIRVGGLTLASVNDRKLLLVTTKPSIELAVEGIGADGVLNIYDETKSTFPLTATILSGLEEPADAYKIESDGILKSSALYFANGQAGGELRLDLSKLGALNSSVRTTLRSNDNAVDDGSGHMRPSLIPLTIDVRNRIAPREKGTAMKIINGFAGTGSAANYNKLLNNNNMTVMGWVRIDSLKVFSGDYSLLTFRDNSGVTGLRLRNGGLLFTQGGRDIWCDVNNFKVTPDNALGCWHHYALVFGNGGIEFYLDGVPFRNSTYKSNTTQGVGGFYMGKNSGIGNNNNDDKFCGAYDQVAAWNRSLSQDEVIRYMYTGVPLDDPGLLTYLNMDFTDQDGRVRDVFTNEELKTTATASLGGSVTFNEPSSFPFDARSFHNLNDPESPISISFPASKARAAVITTFRGTPYCYLEHDLNDFHNYSALNPEFYTITFKELLTNAKRPAETDNVTLTYRHNTIAGDEHLAVAMRRTGSLEHLAGFIHATSVEKGVATFTVPLGYLTDCSEIMFFIYPDESGVISQRQGSLQLEFGKSISSQFKETDDVPTLYLPDGVDMFTIDVDVIATPRNWNQETRIVVNEDTYASVSRYIRKPGTAPQGARSESDGDSEPGSETDPWPGSGLPTGDDYVPDTYEAVSTVDFSLVHNQFVVSIDRDKLDKFGINPITIQADGAEANTLKVNVCFEPYVKLALENGAHRDIVTPGSHDTEGNNETSSSYASRRRAPRTRAASADAENNSIRSSRPVANLEISAELTQGFLAAGEQVKLEVITELDNSLNIGNGSLLKNDAVMFDGLEHHDSRKGPAHAGWNLIGNPYLTDINLTKSRETDFDSSTVTKFLYQCDPATGNYKVHDMTEHDVKHRVHPFHSYFVQAMGPEAVFTVTPVARETEPTKKSRFYEVSQKQSFTFALTNADGSKEYDRVTVSPVGESEFTPNEDAPKMWNITGASPELYAMKDEVETAVATIPENTFRLGLKAPEESELRLALVASEGMSNKKLKVTDNGSLTRAAAWEPSAASPSYQFTAAPGKNDNRFTVGVTSVTTGVEETAAVPYTVEVENHICTVSGLRGNAQIRIYTHNGITVLTDQTSAPTFSAYLENGLYIVIIREDGKEYTSKILVQ